MKKCLLVCPICSKVFKSHETADNHANRKDHWGDYDPTPRKKVEKQNNEVFGVAVDSSIRDNNGELIHFPSDGRPYYDRSLQRTFNTKREKRDYMKEKNLVMDGSADHINKQRIPEAGDNRTRHVR